MGFNIMVTEAGHHAKEKKNNNIVAERFTHLVNHPETAFSGNKTRLARGVKGGQWPAPHKQDQM